MTMLYITYFVIPVVNNTKANLRNVIERLEKAVGYAEQVLKFPPLSYAHRSLFNNYFASSPDKVISTRTIPHQVADVEIRPDSKGFDLVCSGPGGELS